MEGPSAGARMRGYFGVGVEGLSKPRNAGAIFRTAHAFGANFLFGVAPALNLREIQKTDTSATNREVPVFEFETAADLQLPSGCQLVGVEFRDDATELPSFRHPAQAAYIFGTERGSLTPPVVERCDHLIRIPTDFCINVSVAAAIVLYDRMLSRGRFAERPVRAGGPTEGMPEHVHGGIFSRDGTFKS